MNVPIRDSEFWYGGCPEWAAEMPLDARSELTLQVPDGGGILFSSRGRYLCLSAPGALRVCGGSMICPEASYLSEMEGTLASAALAAASRFFPSFGSDNEKILPGSTLLRAGPEAWMDAERLTARLAALKEAGIRPNGLIVDPTQARPDSRLESRLRSLGITPVAAPASTVCGPAEVLIPKLLTASLLGQPNVAAELSGGASPDQMIGQLAAACMMPVIVVSLEALEALSPARKHTVRLQLSLRQFYAPQIREAVHLARSAAVPPVRYLAYGFSEPDCAQIADQYLLGRDLLAAPVLEPDSRERSVYVPRGLWELEGELLESSGQWMNLQSDETQVLLLHRVHHAPSDLGMRDSFYTV